MTTSAISQSIAPFVSLLSSVGIAIAAVAVIAFAAGRTFGGSSRRKRRGIFLLVSVAGFIGIAAYAHLKLQSLPKPAPRAASPALPAELSVRVGGFLRPSATQWTALHAEQAAGGAKRLAIICITPHRYGHTVLR